MPVRASRLTFGDVSWPLAPQPFDRSSALFEPTASMLHQEHRDGTEGPVRTLLNSITVQIAPGKGAKKTK